MNEKHDKSLDMVWIHANKHCVSYRLCDPAAGLSIEQMRHVSSLMLDLFEREAEKMKAAKKERASVPGPSGDPGNPAHSSPVRRFQQSVLR
ncbi:hypothetical protein [Leisingera daeponensis]|uniref:hypothetical protein n=1 Tax=Leisingera daeponensis TaxID=405746 RepID=UPI0012B6643A|nr:hypothetical protein [Leisingera daeponensis]